MSKHTPGPWAAEDLYIVARGYRVATVHVGTSSGDLGESDGREESYADAQLIAAAPRMLKALKAAESILWMASEYAQAGGNGGPEMREYRPVAKEIDDAIAAAEGHS